MVKEYKTASSRIEKTKYYRYINKLAEKGSVPNDDIKQHIEEVLTNEREREVERLDKGPFQAGEGGKSEVDGQPIKKLEIDLRLE